MIYREADRLVARDESRRKIVTWYPDDGPLRCELYPKHLQFFAAGAVHREGLFMAANRVGKTEGVGGYETVLHLTGAYPSWWEGRRFERPVSAWVAGKTNETTRDIVQAKLFGRVEGSGTRKRFAGTGRSAPVRGAARFPTSPTRWRSGTPAAASRRSVSSHTQQGRGAFEGTEQDVVWLDEEPPLDVYVECLVRTMTTGGLVMVTFTPLEGMSDVVMSFLDSGKLPEESA